MWHQSILIFHTHDSSMLDRLQLEVELHDSLLSEQPDRYSAVACFDVLMALRAGKRNETGLFEGTYNLSDIQPPGTRYDAVRTHDGKCLLCSGVFPYHGV